MTGTYILWISTPGQYLHPLATHLQSLHAVLFTYTCMVLTLHHTWPTIHAYHIPSYLAYHTCISHSVTLCIPYMHITFCHTTIHLYHILSHLAYHTCISHSVTLGLPFMHITFCHTCSTIHAYHILLHLAYYTCISYSVTLGLPYMHITLCHTWPTIHASY